MIYFNLKKTFEERFSAKVFLLFTALLIIFSGSFTAFHIHHQSTSLKNTLVADGNLLADLLAYNARLGIFTEENDFFRDPMEGIFQKAEVLSVSIFNSKGERLARKRKDLKISERTQKERGEAIPESIIGELKKNDASFYLETGDAFEFWAPVFARVDFEKESMLLGEYPDQKDEHIIGFVAITMSKHSLRENLVILLTRSAGMGTLFLFFGAAAAYMVAKRVTRPLNKLTEEVRTLGLGKPTRNVPVETRDEIGKLAMAFNAMTYSLKKREAEKETLAEQLLHAQKMEAVGRFSSGITHDFNNILQTIFFNIKLLQNHIGKNTRAILYSDQIFEAAMKASRLASNLLSFSSKQPMKLKPVDINKLIKGSRKLIKALVGEGITLEIQTTKKPLKVMVDRLQIEQILLNLTTNARDAMPNGGTITITAESMDKSHKEDGSTRYALISFTDTGTGIAKKTLKKIFEPFFTTKEMGKGTGLGLSMAHGIVRSHGGFIDLQTKQGKGTTFKISLPLTEAKLIEEDLKDRPKLPGGGSEQLLIAEDDKANRTLMKYILELEGYKVTEAEDGKDAVKRFTENKDAFDLLLFDLRMPKKNGKDAYKEIKKIKPGIKAVFVSGYVNDLTFEEKDVETGICFLSKPVNPEDLLTKIKEVLEK